MISKFRRLLVRFAKYERYGDGDSVGDWEGWYEIFGYCIGFRDIDGRIVTEW